LLTALIVLLSLLLLVSLFSDDNSLLGENKDKTQVRFWEKLYTGEIKKVSQEGELLLTYELRNDPDATGKAPKRYTVEFPKGVLADRYAEILKFVNTPPGKVEASQFMDGLENKSIIRVQEAYTVTTDTGLRLFVKAIRKDDRGPLRYDEVEATIARQGDVNLALAALATEYPSLEIKDYAVASPDSVKASQPNTLFSTLMVTLLPWLLVIGVFWFLIMRQMRNSGGAGGVLSFGRSRAQMISKEKSNVTFDDVAGVEEAKDDVREIIEFLKNPARFSRLGGRIPRGMLLVGPPGTGKTLLAKAIAGEANVPFYSISGSDFVEMFVGVGASRVRDLFRQARENSPCLIFLDEIDAVGRKRGSGLGGGHDEREQTLNAILVEMDGFETDEGIILVAATNRPDVLDPALLRPGRFDRQIQVTLPDVKGREAILAVHTQKVKMAGGVDLTRVARATPGFSGAELAAMVNEAALIATLRNADFVEFSDFEEARDKVRWGRQKKSRVMEEKDRLVTAYHEAGHALVAHFQEEMEPLHKVTIVPRGMSLGATMVLPERDRYNQTRREILSYIAFAYGGRVAEELFCDDISTGAYDDIKRATEMARQFVCQWGMSEGIGPISYAETSDAVFLGNDLMRSKDHSESMSLEIDREIKRVLLECHETAKQSLVEHRELLESLAQALLKYETLTGAEITALVAGEDLDAIKEEEAKRAKVERDRYKAAEEERLRREAAEKADGGEGGLSDLGAGAQPNPA